MCEREREIKEIERYIIEMKWIIPPNPRDGFLIVRRVIITF